MHPSWKGEKGDEAAVMHKEVVMAGGLCQDDLDFLATFPEEKRIRILRKG